MRKIKVFVAGHNGLVGSSLIRFLKKKKNIQIITKNKSDLNLLNQKKVLNFFKNSRIDQVYLAAARVGGIHANNTYPAEFIYENLMIQSNIINSSFLTGIKKLLFLGSSCIYPKNINHKIKEDDLLNGKLEKTNEPYAVAKIAGIKMCESYNRQYGKSHNIDYRSIMPTNLYGPGDNYHAENSHVIPGMIRRFHYAKINNQKTIKIWGSGRPKREFLFVDDLSEAAFKIMNLRKKIYNKFNFNHINVGSGEEISIKNLSEKIKRVVKYKGEIKFDSSKPDGPLRKSINSKFITGLGWQPKLSLSDGLVKTYDDFLKL